MKGEFMFSTGILIKPQQFVWKKKKLNNAVFQLSAVLCRIQLQLTCSWLLQTGHFSKQCLLWHSRSKGGCIPKCSKDIVTIWTVFSLWLHDSMCLISSLYVFVNICFSNTLVVLCDLFRSFLFSPFQYL